MMQEELRNLLLTLPGAQISHGGKEVASRCNVCGDSVHKNHAHMYTNLGYGDTPLVFNCVRCHRNRGLITPDILLEWGLNPSPSLCVDILNYNKKVLRYSKNKQYLDNPVYKLYNYKVTDSRLSELKLNYINKRLGQNLTYKDMIENKICLNLIDLLNINHITKYTQHIDIINQLNNYFVGFISEDNAFINLRCMIKSKELMNKILIKKINRRYTQYNIFGKFDYTRNNYVIPGSIDILSKDNIKINIAEGQFDILSVYYNLRDKDKYNSIYSAISGNNYLSLAMHLLKLLGVPNIEFHIYIDNDINQWNIKVLLNLCRNLNFPLYIHRNAMEGEKDFGVPLDRIKEEVNKLY